MSPQLGARFLERRITKFLASPASVRGAMGVIISAMVVSVVLGGALMRLVEPAAFEGPTDGMWWALQTVTTVGYGDVVPRTVLGRLVGAVFMLQAIAFVSIVTAAITSTFVERARRERHVTGSGDPVDRLAEIAARLERIERALDEHRPSGGPAPR